MPEDVMDRRATLEFLSRHVKAEMLVKQLLTVDREMRGAVGKGQSSK